MSSSRSKNISPFLKTDEVVSVKESPIFRSSTKYSKRVLSENVGIAGDKKKSYGIGNEGIGKLFVSDECETSTSIASRQDSVRNLLVLPPLPKPKWLPSDGTQVDIRIKQQPLSFLEIFSTIQTWIFLLLPVFSSILLAHIPGCYYSTSILDPNLPCQQYSCTFNQNNAIIGVNAVKFLGVALELTPKFMHRITASSPYLDLDSLMIRSEIVSISDDGTASHQSTHNIRLRDHISTLYNSSTRLFTISNSANNIPLGLKTFNNRITEDDYSRSNVVLNITVMSPGFDLLSDSTIIVMTDSPFHSIVASLVELIFLSISLYLLGRIIARLRLYIRVRSHQSTGGAARQHPEYILAEQIFLPVSMAFLCLWLNPIRAALDLLARCRVHIVTGSVRELLYLLSGILEGLACQGK